MKPNLFDYATSELSQDAFLGWYLRWADESMDEDIELQISARKFLIKYIQEQYPNYIHSIKTVEIKKQYNNIDLLVIVNNNLSIIIEDKTDTGTHSNQLQRYKDSISGDKVLLYIKTGNETASKALQIVQKYNYSVIYRKNLLDFWLDCKSNNEIFTSFVKKMTEYENITNSYIQTPIEKWNRTQIQGFYMGIETEINKNGGKADWKYVANPLGGVEVFVWNWRNTTDCAIYLQLENGTLCIKIGEIKSDKNATEIRWKYYKLVQEISKEMNLKIMKPRFHKGKYMTIGIVPNNFIYNSSEFSFEHVIVAFHKYEQLVDKCAAKIQLNN